MSESAGGIRGNMLNQGKADIALRKKKRKEGGVKDGKDQEERVGEREGSKWGYRGSLEVGRNIPIKEFGVENSHIEMIEKGRLENRRKEKGIVSWERGNVKENNMEDVVRKVDLVKGNLMLIDDSKKGYKGETYMSKAC